MKGFSTASKVSLLLRSTIWFCITNCWFAYFFDVDQSNDLSITQLGKFIIKWDSSSPFIQIVYSDHPDEILFQTLPSWPFISAGYATDRRLPLVEGNSKVNSDGHEWTLYETPNQNIKKVIITTEGDFIMSGEVWGSVTLGTYRLRFYIPRDNNGNSLDSQLAFNIDVKAQHGTFNRVYLNYWCNSSENFFGFGTQVKKKFH